MNVIFATNDNFAQYAGVAILSLLDNNKHSHFNINLLCLDVCNENIKKIRELTSNYDCTFNIINVDESTFDGCPDPGQYSKACYLRLLTPDLLPKVDKVLYLDCDLVVNGDIEELYNTDMEGYAVAGVSDCTLSFNIIEPYIGYDFMEYGYINSGVLLLNLKYWREHHSKEALFEYLHTHKVCLPDQDAINYVFHKQVLKLHPKWNCHVGFFAFPPLVIPEQKRFVKELWTGAKIIHFTGPAKPWTKECVNPYKKVFLKYKLMTPWKDFPPPHLLSIRHVFNRQG